MKYTYTVITDSGKKIVKESNEDLTAVEFIEKYDPDEYESLYDEAEVAAQEAGEEFDEDEFRDGIRYKEFIKKENK